MYIIIFIVLIGIAIAACSEKAEEEARRKYRASSCKKHITHKRSRNPKSYRVNLYGEIFDQK